MARTEAGCSKSSSSEAAGSSATEAYPRGTSQGDERLRTQLASFLSRLLDGGLEEAQLPLLSSGQRDGVTFGKAGIAVLTRCAGRGVQHAVEA
jgi:hypothetical protein